MRVLKYVVPLMAFALIVGISYKLWSFYAVGSWTRDGRIRADIVQVSSQISGRVTSLPVTDNQYVAQGELLFTIEDEDYHIRLRESEAQLQALNVEHQNAKRQYERRASLTADAISKEDIANARAKVDTLVANIQQIEVAIEQDRLNVLRTKVYAPANGFVTNLRLKQGDFVPTGQPLFALVDSDSFYVIAYFEETKMPHVRSGKRVQIIPYDGGATMTGVIHSYGRAVTDQSSATGEGLLLNVQPTYPWVRLAQRIPVRISIDNLQAKQLDKMLIAGSTCTVKIVD